MDYDELRTFIEKSMRMSHIYQPVMLMTLLRYGGAATVRQIASEILSHDESQIEYYESITKEMVGRVLRNRKVVEKSGSEFRLLGFDALKPEHAAELMALCRKKLDEFKEKRGDAVWSHRTMSEGYISGTIRYEVLKRARFRCELCGISAEVKALEVDHIVPRNKGGSDDPSNSASGTNPRGCSRSPAPDQRHARPRPLPPEPRPLLRAALPARRTAVL